jgi:hypothetical protein
MPFPKIFMADPKHQRGGYNRAKVLSPEKRVEIARKGGTARWSERGVLSPGTKYYLDYLEEVHRFYAGKPELIAMVAEPALQAMHAWQVREAQQEIAEESQRQMEAAIADEMGDHS